MHILVVGGGIAGLGTALACARDGHAVTVLERDATPMPASAEAAFSWERRGAPQVQHSHAFLARLRLLLLDRAPDVLEDLLAEGAMEIPFTAYLPETIADKSAYPGDEDLVGLGCRRTTLEWVLRRKVLAEPGVTFRSGIAVEHLDAVPGDPVRVVGAAGIAADLVVDARGHRSTSNAWFAAIGAPEPPEVLNETGIVYYSRFYRVLDGADAPEIVVPVAVDFGYLKAFLFAGDNRTFSITWSFNAKDRELRNLVGYVEGFEAAAQSIVPIRCWRTPGVSEPLTDVNVMAGLQNRNRPFVVDGQPIVHGFLPVGDAAVTTNALYGRGCTLAMVHAYGLADALRQHGDDLRALALAHNEFTERELTTWFYESSWQDEQVRLFNEGVVFDDDDPRLFMQQIFREGYLPAMKTSPLVFRSFLRWFNLLSGPLDVVGGDPEVTAAVLTAFQARDQRLDVGGFGPDREAFLLAGADVEPSPMLAYAQPA